MTVESFLCEWLTCDAAFDDPELLYNHLCNDHIGRKSTNNLCLTCRWKDCGTSCAKRDHITSHLRGIPPPSPYSSSLSLTPLTSTHTPQAPCMRGTRPPCSLLPRSPPSDLQEIFQASPGPQKARKDSHRRAPCAAQALKGHHRKRSRLRLPCARRSSPQQGGSQQVPLRKAPCASLFAPQPA